MPTPLARLLHLFQLGEFTLASGTTSNWKIECDALAPEEWDALAAMLVTRVGLFSWVVGVPRGGIPLANAMQRYTRPQEDHPVLICEDVVTTGGSIERFRESLGTSVGTHALGCCIFSRGTCPSWVTPLFTIAPLVNPATHAGAPR